MTLAGPGAVRNSVLVRVSLAFLVVLAFVAATFAAFLVSSRQARHAEAAALRSEELQRRTAAVLKLVLDAQTGARGYVITRQPRFLEPFHAAQTALDPTLSALRAAVSDPGEAAAAARLARSTRAFLAGFETRLVALARTDPRRARELVLSGEGKRRVDAIRAQVAALDRSIAAVARDERRSARSARSTTAAVGVAGLVATVLMLLGLAAYLAMAVLRPLRSTAEAARCLARGERGVRVPVRHADDEVAALSTAFNQMSAALEQADADVRRSAAEVDRFFRLAPELLCIADTRGYFRRTNPAFSDILGYTGDELTSRPFLDLVHPDDRDATIAQIGALAEGRPAVAFDNRYRCADGTYIWLHWNAAPADDGLIYAAASDSTGRRRAEEALEQAADEAKRANAAKSEFISRMSHELRTPLNSILGFSQLMQMDGLREDQTEHVDHVIRSGKHLLALINEVLDMSRIEAGKLSISTEPVEVDRAVDDAVASMVPLAAENGTLLTSGDRLPGVFMRADQQRVRQILLNLLSNAIKYGGGRVCVSAVSTDDRVCIRVKDDGGQITGDQLAVMFRPFERLGAAGGDQEGTGLGLALARRLVGLMAGTLEAESAPETGTCFTVSLPRGEPPADPAEDDPQERTSMVRGSSFRIVYIEDNIANLELVEAIVGRIGGEILPALSGEPGVALAGTEQPDLVLLDLHLPGVSGLDVLRELRRRPETQRIPVVLLTADATAQTRRRAEDLGADACLTKPLDIDEFLATLDELIVRV